MPKDKRKRKRKEVGSSSRGPTIRDQPSEDELIVEEEPQTPEGPIGGGVDDIVFEGAVYKERHARLRYREQLATKFFDVPTLQALGLENGVRTLLRKGGLEGCLDKSEKVYARLTVEFLCTLYLRKSRRGLSHNKISFQLLGAEYSMKYPEIAKAFGWEYREEEWEEPPRGTISIFWRNLTATHYKGEGHKSKHIPVPAFRLLSRFLRANIFCQGEPTSIKRQELACLWALSNEGVGMPNWVDIWVQRCLDMQNSPAGKLSFGGMVTLLARFVGIDIPNDCVRSKDGAGEFYDIPSLGRMEFIRYTRTRGSDLDHAYWLLKDSKEIYIPPHPPDLFDIHPQDSTYDLMSRTLDAVGIVPPPLQLFPEENAENNDNEEDDAEDMDYDPEEPEPDNNEDYWRQRMTQQLDSMEGHLQQFGSTIATLHENLYARLDSHDERLLRLETQMTTLMRYGEAAMDYLARVGGANFQDPRQAAQAEHARQETSGMPLPAEAQQRGNSGLDP